MITGLDTGLGFYRQVLALRGDRQEILSSNIANANTPGFKARDLDFKAALSAAVNAAAPPEARNGTAPVWLVSNPRHLAPSGAVPDSVSAFVKYQADTQVTLDGNSVDLGKEKVEAAANAIDYSAAATFTTQTLRMLQIAIGSASGSQAGG